MSRDITKLGLIIICMFHTLSQNSCDFFFERRIVFQSIKFHFQKEMFSFLRSNLLRGPWRREYAEAFLFFRLSLMIASIWILW